MASRSSLGLLGLLLAIGCGTPSPPAGETDASSSGSGTGTSNGSVSATSSTSTSSSDSTAVDGSSSSSDSSTGEPPPFSCPPEDFEVQCDLEAQDCPEGFHCVPWDPDEDGTADSIVCGPISDNPVEPFGECTPDPAACTDDCGAGTICDDRFGIARCMPVCDVEQGDDATCSEGDLCVTCALCAVGACFPGCDPLAPACPELPGVCAFLPGDGFACVEGMLGEGALGEVCDNPNGCAEGLLCINSDALDQCAGQSCCTEMCDLADGDPGCTDPAHVCISLFGPEPAPAGQGHVGICALPSADPCMQTGACPPPGIDDTMPWCSQANEQACVDGGFAGFGNLMTCEEGCLCATSCTGPGAGDCPVPPTGTATPECVVDPLGPGSPTTCLLSCAAGETCPDGMTCTDQLTGDPLCVWITELPPERC